MKTVVILTAAISFSMVIGGVVQGNSASWLLAAWITALMVGVVAGYVLALHYVRHLGREVQDELYVCPLCGRSSAHPEDLAHSYCGCCGSADGLLPKDCEHRRAQNLTKQGGS